MNELYTEIQNAANIVAAPNWADKLSALAAIIAVIVAVIVALRQNKILKQQNEIAIKQAEIAEQQNKIALFEKRYKIFRTISKCIAFAENVKLYCKTQNDIYQHFASIFGIEDNYQEDEREKKFILKLCEIAEDIAQTQFVFSWNIEKYAMSLCMDITFFIKACFIPNGENMAEQKDFFKCFLVQDLQEKIYKQMTNELTLQKEQ